MTYHQFQKQFKRERVFLTWSFVVLILAVGGMSAFEHLQELSSIAAQAYENPTETFSSVIRGMAQ